MKLIFCFRKKQWKEYRGLPEMDVLLRELEQAGIAWKFRTGLENRAEALLSGQGDVEGSLELMGGDTIVVTDDVSLAQEMKRQGLCCIGWQEPSDTAYFPGAEAVITSLEGLSAEFFRQIHHHFYGIPVLIAQTQRLTIRESVLEDFGELYSISREKGSDHYTETMSGDQELERDKFQAYIAQAYAYYGFGLWTVLEKDTGKIVGRCGLSPSPEGSLELGYLIGSAYRRKGYAFEACKKILEYVAENFPGMPIYAEIHQENVASRKLAEKLGFCQIPSNFSGRAVLWQALLNHAEWDILNKKISDSRKLIL